MPLPRYPWPDNFPDVVLHTTVRNRDAHPSYADAKAGNVDAALTLADDLVDDDAVGALRPLTHDQTPYLLPVIADETLGSNAIPDAMAQRIGRMLKLWIAPGEVVQTNKVGHTRAPAFKGWLRPPSSMAKSSAVQVISSSMIMSVWAARWPT